MHLAGHFVSICHSQYMSKHDVLKSLDDKLGHNKYSVKLR